MTFNNPEYDVEDFLLTKIAEESPTFRSYLSGLLDDTGEDGQTNTAWLGTLPTGSKQVQVTLTVTQDINNFVDEG